MRIFLISLIFLSLSSFEAHSKAKDAILSIDQKERVRRIITEIIDETHQSLQKVQIELYSINSDSYFLVSNFGAGRAFLGKSNYRIGISPFIFKKGISDKALKGVLAHELVHTEDYASGSTIGTLIPIGFKVLKKKSRIQYERKTDIKTIQKGYANGLKAYRLWQRELLSNEDLEIKEEEYLTPNEIDLIEKINDDNPELVSQWLKKTAPVNEEAILFDLARTNDDFDYSHFQADLERSKNRRLGRNRSNNNHYYSFEIEAQKESFINCQITLIPQFSEDKFRYDRKRSFENVNLLKDKKVTLKFRSSFNFFMGIMRVYDCDNNPKYDALIKVD